MSQHCYAAISLIFLMLNSLCLAKHPDISFYKGDENKSFITSPVADALGGGAAVYVCNAFFGGLHNYSQKGYSDEQLSSKYEAAQQQAQQVCVRYAEVQQYTKQLYAQTLSKALRGSLLQMVSNRIGAYYVDMRDYPELQRQYDVFLYAMQKYFDPETGLLCDLSCADAQVETVLHELCPDLPHDQYCECLSCHNVHSPYVFRVADAIGRGVKRVITPNYVSKIRSNSYNNKIMQVFECCQHDDYEGAQRLLSDIVAQVSVNASVRDALDRAVNECRERHEISVCRGIENEWLACEAAYTKEEFCKDIALDDEMLSKRLESQGLSELYERCVNLQYAPDDVLLDIYEMRRTAIKETLHNGGKQYCQSHAVTPDMHNLLSEYGLDAAVFTEFTGTTLQQELHGELVSVLNDSSSLWRYYVPAHTESVVRATAQCAVVAQHYNQLGQTERAYAFADAAHTLCAFGKGFCKGVCKSACSAGQAVLGIAQAVVHPRETATALGDCVASVALSLSKAFLTVANDPYEAVVWSQATFRYGEQAIVQSAQWWNGLAEEEKVEQLGCAFGRVATSLAGGAALRCAGTAVQCSSAATRVKDEIQKIKQNVYVLVDQARQHGRQLTMDVIDFVRCQPSLVTNTGDVVKTTGEIFKNKKSFYLCKREIDGIWAQRTSKAARAARDPQSLSGKIKNAGLPHRGQFHYRAPKRLRPGDELPTLNNTGRAIYIDRYGNKWMQGVSRTLGQKTEWDVQLSQGAYQRYGHLAKNGKKYLNVSLDGRITH